MHSKSYAITMVVNKKGGTILSIECHDCAASQGGCKHAVTFLMWLHRRSEVGTTLKFMIAKELSKDPPTSLRRKNDVLSEIFEKGL